MLPATLLCCPRRHLKQGKVFESFPAKAEIEGRISLETYELFISGDVYYINSSFIKKC
jgi:hypothetical protein